MGLSFKQIRIAILLMLLVTAAIYTQDQKLSTAYWYKTIEVAIYPINGDGSAATNSYIEQLTEQDFASIDTFFEEQSELYQLISPQPLVTKLGPIVHQHPPEPPESRNILSIMLWSLKLRYWVYKHTPDESNGEHRIRLFVLYHKADNNKALAHSLGLQKGLIGVIHAFADDRQTQQNAVVMAHEILHTVGASDKYDSYNQPIFPSGYAEPDKTPLHPQRYAELMAGRIAVSENDAHIPHSLKQVRIGEETAREIQWIQP
jgi:hypothetical protein